jgi:hypothetical protein
MSGIVITSLMDCYSPSRSNLARPSFRLPGYRQSLHLLAKPRRQTTWLSHLTLRNTTPRRQFVRYFRSLISATTVFGFLDDLRERSNVQYLQAFRNCAVVSGYLMSSDSGRSVAVECCGVQQNLTQAELRLHLGSTLAHNLIAKYMELPFDFRR